MKSILAAAAVLSGLAFTTVAHATPIIYQFSASGGELRDRFLHLQRGDRGVRYIHHDRWQITVLGFRARRCFPREDHGDNANGVSRSAAVVIVGITSSGALVLRWD